MTRFLYIFLLVFTLSGNANSPQPIARKFTQADVLIDTAHVQKVRFQQNFKQKYSKDDFAYEPKKREINAWDRFVAWISELLSRLFSFTKNETTNDAISLVMKTIAIGIVLFVVYLIVKSILNKEGQWVFGKNTNRGILTYNDLEKNLQTTDFQKLTAKSEKDGDNRLSIRYYYLWLLKTFAAQEIIVWDIEKTNSDYLYEIKNEKTKSDFQYLSYLYNYCWYGEFDLTADDFQQAKSLFETYVKPQKR